MQPETTNPKLIIRLTVDPAAPTVVQREDLQNGGHRLLFPVAHARELARLLTEMLAAARSGLLARCTYENLILETTTEEAMQFKQQDIEFPEFARRLGFEDNSYRNDSCGCAVLRLAPGEDFPIIVLWCDHADPRDREMEDAPRFWAYHCATEAQECDPEGAADVIYQGEDPAACEAAIAARIAEARG